MYEYIFLRNEVQYWHDFRFFSSKGRETNSNFASSLHFAYQSILHQAIERTQLRVKDYLLCGGMEGLMMDFYFAKEYQVVKSRYVSMIERRISIVEVDRLIF
eukprot:36944_1